MARRYKPTYTTRVTQVTSVIDGDTFKATLDYSPRVRWFGAIRLDGIDTPEVRGPEKPEGLKVKAIVQDKFAKAKAIVVTMRKYGKYGRTVAKVYLGKHKTATDGEVIAEGVCLNDWLVEHGHARKVRY